MKAVWAFARKRVARRAEPKLTPTTTHDAQHEAACHAATLLTSRVLTLAHMLEDKPLCERFAAFLASEFSGENLAFHQGASAFLDASEAAPHERQRRRSEAGALINHFVRPGSAEEINLPAGLRASLLEAFSTVDEEDLVTQMRSARREIFKLMERDSFSRFLLTLRNEGGATGARSAGKASERPSTLGTPPPLPRPQLKLPLEVDCPSTKVAMGIASITGWSSSNTVMADTIGNTVGR